MSENKETTFDNKCLILSEFWMEFRDEITFEDFVQYNDLGLPIAYAVKEGIVNSNKKTESFIDETFALLLSTFELEDTGFESLDEILGLDFNE